LGRSPRAFGKVNKDRFGIVRLGNLAEVLVVNPRKSITKELEEPLRNQLPKKKTGKTFSASRGFGE
jgi:hypothetical protein